MLPGYNFIHKSRKEGRGGGVGFFVRRDIEFLKEDLPTSMTVTAFENLFISIPQGKGTPILIGVVYRPPGSNLDEFNMQFDSLMENLTIGKNNKKKLFLTGDFNIDLLAFDNHTPTNDFIECMTVHHFFPLILQPTRITPTTATLIDNTFTNSLDCIIDSAIVTSDISDHLPIITWTQTKPHTMQNMGKIEMTRTTSKEASEMFKSTLSNVDWAPIIASCNENDPSQAYNLFVKVIKASYDKAFPLKPKKISKKNTFHQPWMTQGLLNSIKKKEKLYIKYIKNPTPENKNIFTKYRNNYKVIRTRVEQSYYTNEFIKYNKDIKKTWQVIRKIVKTENKDTWINEINLNGELISDPNIMAEHFNSYFTGMAKALSNKIPPSNKGFQDYLPPSSVNSFVLIPTCPQELIAINKTFKSTHSSGADDMNPHLLSPVLEFLAAPLAEIINCSLKNGVVPAEAKIAKVLPIHKQGIKTEVTNYRPISILPFFSKLFEKVMYDRLLLYIKQKNLLYPLQHGFQPGHSTSMSLLDIQDKITMAMDKNEYSMGIFLDLAKAFDTVDHKILLAKLEHYGIRGNALNWFKSYLTNRYQKVSCNGRLSNLQLIEFGVPQGSILGPLLFLIYINDLPNSSSILHYILFADDSNVFLSHASYDQLFQLANNELTSASDWFKANKLSLNLSKTNYIIFRSTKKLIPNNTNELLIDNKIIPEVLTTKFLGVHIDQNLKWKTHITEISNKIKKNIGIIKRVSYLLPLYVLTDLYYTLIYPYLTYCNLIWSSTYDTHLNGLKILQKKAIRVISKSPGYSHTGPLFLEYKLLNIRQIKFIQTCEFMYQYTNNLLPPAFPPTSLLYCILASLEATVIIEV